MRPSSVELLRSGLGKKISRAHFSPAAARPPGNVVASCGSGLDCGVRVDPGERRRAAVGWVSLCRRIQVRLWTPVGPGSRRRRVLLLRTPPEKVG